MDEKKELLITNINEINTKNKEKTRLKTGGKGEKERNKKIPAPGS